MPLNSMTGFARAEANHGSLSVQIEARCVNGRSSDIKLRLPAGFDHLDKPIRALFQGVIRRGNVNVNVSLQRDAERQPRINVDTLENLRVTLCERASAWGDPAPTLSDLLALPGVVEMVDPAAADTSEAASQARDAALLACAETCAIELGKARAAEGDAMLAVLHGLVAEIERETQALAEHPEARGEHLMARLKSQVGRLLEDANPLDEQRLHQEAAVLATKADIEEELARLRAHIDAARALLYVSEPVGRKLDFLAQEFNREANTICSKASTITVTQHGLALKALIDQVKEQVQNVE
ncbi:MAG: YicC/YloC family endoribonuclease [Hyphomicrobiales bacterium]|jgi:uncharacterized protein (TIGR00255 family)